METFWLWKILCTTLKPNATFRPQRIPRILTILLTFKDTFHLDWCLPYRLSPIENDFFLVNLRYHIWQITISKNKIFETLVNDEGVKYDRLPQAGLRGIVRQLQEWRWEQIEGVCRRWSSKREIQLAEDYERSNTQLIMLLSIWGSFLKWIYTSPSVLQETKWWGTLPLPIGSLESIKVLNTQRNRTR